MNTLKPSMMYSVYPVGSQEVMKAMNILLKGQCYRKTIIVHSSQHELEACFSMVQVMGSLSQFSWLTTEN